MLALYSELILTPRELRHEISELFNFRYSPSLFYEIVAHLFKHSFIDVIINFNFDEILDQAIEEELGKDNYHHIISDGDCEPINNLMIDGRLKIPIYIKPHGTVRHKSTLRFTKRHYLDIPEQIKNVIIDLVKGERGEVGGAKVENISQVNIISAGFNMESLEFNDIINIYLPEQSKIYHLCHELTEERCIGSFVENVFPDFFKRAYQYHLIKKNRDWNFENFDNHIYKRIAIKNFNIADKKNELTTPFAEIFSYAWRKIFYSFRKSFRPRSIARHEIINYFFYDNQFSQRDVARAEENRNQLSKIYEEGMEYFLDRTIVEIAIAINRNNGIIEITRLLGDRAGFYYKKYRDRYYQFAKTNKGALSIYDLLNQFQGPSYQNENEDGTYSKNIFELNTDSYEKLKKVDKILKSLKEDGELGDSRLNERMRRWEEKIPVRNDKGKIEIERDQSGVKLILKTFSSIFDDNTTSHNRTSIMVLFRLFKIKYLSERFVANFKRNLTKNIYNGNSYNNDKLYPGKDIVLVQEIARLFLKSSRQHYYSIRAKYHDPKNFISESFSKTRLLHTILSVEYNIKNMFLNTEWDVVFMISETGSMLNVLRNEHRTKNILKGKKVIIINSFEAIKLLQSNDSNILDANKSLSAREVNINHNKQYLKMLPEDTDLYENIFYTFSLPSVRHNHHMILFLKKTVEKKEEISSLDVTAYQIERDITKPLFKMSAAMYIYREGFSNHLNPLFIGIAPYNSRENIPALRHDFKKLLRIFTVTFCRSLTFEGTKIQGLDLILDTYNWNLEKEKKNIETFLAYLHDSTNAIFVPQLDNQIS